MTAWNRIRYYGTHYQEQTVDRMRRLLTANITLIEIDGLPDNTHGIRLQTLYFNQYTKRKWTSCNGNITIYLHTNKQYGNKTLLHCE